MFQMWIIFLLTWLSVEDWKEGLLSLPIIFLLGASGFVHAICTGMTVYPWIGIGLLIFGRCTHEKIGYGDGWLMTALGMWLLPVQLLEILLGGICTGILWAVVHKKKEIPLVPFMTVIYVAGEVI